MGDNTPRWMIPDRGCLMLPVLVGDEWFGQVDGNIVNITEEYEEWAKTNSRFRTRYGEINDSTKPNQV